MKEVSKSLETRAESLQAELSSILDQESISKQSLQTRILENEQLRLQLGILLLPYIHPNYLTINI